MDIRTCASLCLLPAIPLPESSRGYKRELWHKFRDFAIEVAVRLMASSFPSMPTSSHTNKRNAKSALAMFLPSSSAHADATTLRGKCIPPRNRAKLRIGSFQSSSEEETRDLHKQLESLHGEEHMEAADKSHQQKMYRRLRSQDSVTASRNPRLSTNNWLLAPGCCCSFRTGS